jgi:hypothetical protein
MRPVSRRQQHLAFLGAPNRVRTGPHEQVYTNRSTRTGLHEQVCTNRSTGRSQLGKAFPWGDVRKEFFGATLVIHNERVRQGYKRWPGMVHSTIVRQLVTEFK